MTERSQDIPLQTRGASFGDAFLASLAVGRSALSDIARWNPTSRVAGPRPELAALYGRRFALYKQLYGQTKAIMSALSKAET